MTTIETWVLAYRDTIKNKLECLEEAFSHMEEQLKILKKEIDSFIDFLDKNGRFK